MGQTLDVETLRQRGGPELFIRIYGRNFRLLAICTGPNCDGEANEYMAKHENAAVISGAVMGPVYIADKRDVGLIEQRAAAIKAHG